MVNVISSSFAFKIYKEQWLIIAIFALVMCLAIDWGLPNKKRIDLLIGGSPPTETQLQRLSQVRKKALEKRDLLKNNASQKAMRGEGVSFRIESLVDGGGGSLLNEDERLLAFRTYLISGSAIDESKTFSVLSRMNPRKLDFDPKFYNYGGTYIYPLGMILFALKSIGLLSVTSNQAYYLQHPSDIRLMYICGRALNVLSFIGTLIVLALFGKMFHDRMSGTFAMLTYAFSTLPLTMCLVSKPHVYSAFWTLLAIYLVVLYAKYRKSSHLVFSVIAAGWALGASLATGIIALIYPILLFDPQRIKLSLKHICLVFVGIGTIYLLTNPYAILSFTRYVGDFISATSSDSHGLGTFAIYGIVPYLENIFIQSYTFPLAIIGFLYMVLACLSGYTLITSRVAFASVFFITLFAFLQFSARHILFIGPLICLFSGIALSKLVSKYCRGVQIVKVSFLILIFLPGGFFSVLLARDYIFDDKWYEPTLQWTESANIGSQTSIGFLGGLGPVKTPPFPFLQSQIINLEKMSINDELPDYVIMGNYDKNRKRWKEHPLSPRYKLIFDLGNQPSYEGFLILELRAMKGPRAGFVSLRMAPKN